MTLNYRRSLLLILLLSILTNCRFKTERVSDVCKKDNKTTVFFDIKGYFCNIVNEYESTNRKVNKQVRFGNKSEFHESMSVDWKAELLGFINTDINRSSWIENFAVDTITRDNGSTILYQTTDASIPIKKMEINFSATNEVMEIDIISERKSLLYKSKQKLHFQPNVSYSVTGWQRTLMLSQTDFEVKANIVANK